MTAWRKDTITKRVLNDATLGRDVAAIVRSTGVKPQTVRQVLRRAAISGDIHLTRFRRGRSSRVIQVAEKVEVAVLDVEALNNLLIGWSKG